MSGFKWNSKGKKFKEEIERLNKTKVQVGYISGRDEYEDGVDLCDVAAFNELGTETIPSRPFIRMGLQRHASDISNVMRMTVKGISNGDSADKWLKTLGLVAKDAVQGSFTENKFVPNAPSTLAKKYPKTRPLIDTGLLRQGVVYVINEDGQRTVVK